MCGTLFFHSHVSSAFVCELPTNRAKKKRKQETNHTQRASERETFISIPTIHYSDVTGVRMSRSILYMLVYEYVRLSFLVCGLILHFAVFFRIPLKRGNRFPFPFPLTFSFYFLLWDLIVLFFAVQCLYFPYFVMDHFSTQFTANSNHTLLESRFFFGSFQIMVTISNKNVHTNDEAAKKCKEIENKKKDENGTQQRLNQHENYITRWGLCSVCMFDVDSTLCV